MPYIFTMFHIFPEIKMSYFPQYLFFPSTCFIFPFYCYIFPCIPFYLFIYLLCSCIIFPLYLYYFSNVPVLTPTAPYLVCFSLYIYFTCVSGVFGPLRLQKHRPHQCYPFPINSFESELFPIKLEANHVIEDKQVWVAL